MEYKLGKDFKPQIKVDPWDAYNCDHTIGVVIHEVMKEYLRQNRGHGRMDIEDIPKEYQENWDEKQDFEVGYSHKAWNWMLEEIIWATDMDNRYEDVDPDTEGRRSNAMRLFGKYFFSFWN